MFPAVGVMLRSLHAVTGGLLQRGLKFQTCMNILSEFFLPCPGIFGSHLIYVHYYSFPYWIWFSHAVFCFAKCMSVA